ncbi:FUSC family protein [Catenulispora sp. NL8]|uniref:FUSC family protein n=1 Tax=Catenulispora pinistramenti TaxID=2705254 RepID=A0ABS5KMA5_9ACTN|nr:FUSC family protein [Catenulispora pinistramenti]MBS2547151.1 FUSC family protein [Catenulispora pinistramenti]
MTSLYPSHRRPLPALRDSLHVRRVHGSATVFTALRAALAVGAPAALVLVLGRPDLAAFAISGALAILYAQQKPRRLRMGTTAGAAIALQAAGAMALLAASLHTPTAGRVLAVGAIALSAKLACDVLGATPPGGIIITFSSAALAFTPQQLHEIPGHVAVGVLGGLWAVALSFFGPAVPGPAAALEARAARGAGTVRGAGTAQTPAPGRTASPARRPHVRPHLPGALRVGVGATLAGLVCLTLGVDRPYWAMIAAAAVLQGPTVGMVYQRSIQRCMGTVAGVALTAVFVVAGGGHLWPLAIGMPVLMFAAECLIARNYALAVTFVTPLALSMSEFMHWTSARPMVTSRLIDTVAGSVIGLAAAMIITNRRVVDGVEAALERVDHAHTVLDRAPAEAETETPNPALHTARAALTAELAALRTAYDTARSEWYLKSLPHEAVQAAEHTGRQLLGRQA